jgi:hypothetical protein
MCLLDLLQKYNYKSKVGILLSGANADGTKGPPELLKKWEEQL